MTIYKVSWKRAENHARKNNVLQGLFTSAVYLNCKLSTFLRECCVMKTIFKRITAVITAAVVLAASVVFDVPKSLTAKAAKRHLRH